MRISDSHVLQGALTLLESKADAKVQGTFRHMYSVSRKSSSPITFCNIFT